MQAFIKKWGKTSCTDCMYKGALGIVLIVYFRALREVAKKVIFFSGPATTYYVVHTLDGSLELVAH